MSRLLNFRDLGDELRMSRSMEWWFVCMVNSCRVYNKVIKFFNIVYKFFKVVFEVFIGKIFK